MAEMLNVVGSLQTISSTGRPSEGGTSCRAVIYSAIYGTNHTHFPAIATGTALGICNAHTISMNHH